MDYFLQKVSGQPARQTVTLRRCTPAEAPAVFVLQNEVRAAMPHPEQFVPDTLENITDYLRTGIGIGAWQQGRLGAYLILRLCGQSSENYAAFLGVPQSQWQHWANADSAVVHPDSDDETGSLCVAQTVTVIRTDSSAQMGNLRRQQR